ncbi:MAG: T9SS type A sorting domain-containing protein [Chitinophagaceae bacterium]
MKRLLLLTTIGMLFCIAFSQAQNVFSPDDSLYRYSSSATLGSVNRPDPSITGLQKWVATSINGISTGSNSYDTKSFKPYFINGGSQNIPFRLKYPKTFKDNPGKKYPIMVFFHGAGEGGCSTNNGVYNNELQLLHGGKVFRDWVDGGQFDGFLLYPQSVMTSGCSSQWGDPNGNLSGSKIGIVLRIVDSLVKYARVDIDRVFVDGLSDGGSAAWNMAYYYPQRVAKIAPSSAALNTSFSLTPIVHIPIWFASGGTDTNPSPGTANTIYTGLKNLGADITYTLFAGMGHGIWYNHWAMPGFTDYMNDVHKANPLVFFQRLQYCPETTISAKMGLTPGFYAYEWRKDGTTTIATMTNGTNTILVPTNITSFTGNEITVNAYGSYDVRFKRSATSDWSDWSPKPAVISPKSVTQTPPIQVNGMVSNVLPSVDGSTTVSLKLPAGYDSYKWYKNDALISGATDSLYTAGIGSYKAQVVETNGCGTLFSPVFKVVDATGIPKPEAAKNLTANAISITSVQLDWAENPNASEQETGYEIYRGTVTGGPYKLIAVTAPNVVTYLDNNLSSNTTYYYVIRAVGANGAAANSNQASAKTELDNSAPTAPGNFMLQGIATSYALLKWNASTDNVGVLRYNIYLNGVKTYITTDTTFAASNLDSNKVYTFYVRAEDAAGNLSVASNQITAATNFTATGINYKTYQGVWTALPDFAAEPIIKTGTYTSPNNTMIPIKPRLDQFGILYEGYIKIPTTANYTFELCSDDGSKFFIGQPYDNNATPLITNDGSHSITTCVSASIYLQAGFYPIALPFFDITGTDSITLKWQNDAGLSKALVPAANFFRTYNVGNSAPAAPSSLKATAAAYNKINLTWVSNSVNQTGFELVRATSATGPFAPVANTTGTSFSDSGLVANTTYYYKVRAVGTGGESDYAYNFNEVNWKVNNSGADAFGSTTRTLTLNSPTTYSAVTPKEGTHSILFTGATSSNSYATVDNSTSGFPNDGYYTQRTVALWIKATATNNKRVVFDFGNNANGLGLRFNAGVLEAGVASTSIRVKIASAAVTGISGWNNNDWNHVAVVYNQASLKLFVNGVQVIANDALGITNIAAPTATVARFGYSNATGSTENVFNEATGTSDYFSGNMDDIYVINGALTAADLATLMNFTYKPSAVTTLAAPATPATPTGLTATALSTSTATLSWTDNANNEQGYEVWRSSGNNTTYRKVAVLAAGNGTMTYMDDSLFANVTYYYKVRAIGQVNSSAYSNEASTITKNSKPVISLIPNYTMKYGTTLTLPVTAKDPDGDLLVFSYEKLPSFATTQDISNGKASITFTTNVRSQGVYTMKVYVADEFGGKDTATFAMSVNNNGVPVLNTISDVTMNEGDSVYVSFTANDPEGNSTMSWNLVDSLSFGTLVNKGNGQAGLILKPGYLAAGTYPVTVHVNDGYGAWAERTFNVKVNDKDPNETIQLNMMYYTGGVSLWNDLDLKSGSSFSNFKNIKGETTTVGFNIVGYNTDWHPADGGAQTGNNSGVYPDNVMKDRLQWGFFNGSSYDSVRVRISGLNPAGRYNFTFFGSYVCDFCGMTANSVTTYKIGNQSAAVHFSSNTTETGTVYQVQPNTNGEVFINMIGDQANANSGGVLNALVIQTIYDDGLPPAKPLNFYGQTITGGIKLNWQDVSLSEEAYRVYRATNVAGPYTLLNPSALNKDSITYSDMAVTSYTQYYYYIQGVNRYGASASSDTIAITSANNVPVIGSISSVSIKSDSTAQRNFTITDDPTDIITVSIPNKPYFVNVSSLGGSNYRMQVTPAVGDVGTYNLTVIATDDKGAADSTNVTITITDKNTRSVYINFSSGNNAPAPWNNYFIYAGAGTLSSLVDEKNTTTGMSMQLVQAWSGTNEYLGFVTGNNSGVFSDQVLSAGLLNTTTTAVQIKFSGLDNAKKYNLVFVGSRNEGLNATTKFTCGSVSDTLNASYNSNQTANLNGLTPTSGALTVDITKLSAATFAALNAIQIEEYTTTTPLNPTNLDAEPLTRNKIRLTWSDRTTTSGNFQLQRATDSLFTTNAVTMNIPAHITTYIDSSVAPNTKYWYRIRERISNTFYDYSNITRTITPQSIVYINLNYSTGSVGAPWNNWESFPVYYNVFTGLTDQGGQPSGLTLSIVKTMNGDNNYGVVTGNNSGIVPDGVLQSNYWIDRQQLAQMKLSGLALNKRYRVGFIGSMSTDGWFQGDYTAKYIINGRTVYLNSWMNSTKIVYIGDLTSDANGELMLNFTTTDQAAWAFNAGLIVEAYDDKVSGAGTVLNGNADSVVVTPTTDAPATAQPTAEPSIMRTKVYPNPFTDIINVDFNNTASDNVVNVNVFDMNGRLVLRQSFGKLSEGFNTLRVNTAGAGLPTGLYTMTLNINGKVAQVTKMFKNKQ